MLKREPQVKKQNRLQAVYLLVTGQAKSRSTVAKMLGFNRNTISDWLGLYEENGLAKLLDIHQSSGAPTKIPVAALAEIKEILGTEKGFRTYKEIHHLVVHKYEAAVGYSTVHNLVRYKLAAKAKTPRPSNPKKSGRSNGI